MNNVINKENTDIWLRPWDIEQDELYNRDDRFFSVLLKGVFFFLNTNIVLYGKSINHFIFNTGSSYLYMEANNYQFKWKEINNDNTMYMHLPRCVVEQQNVSILPEELTQPFVRGVYERRSGDDIKGYNAEMRRLPLEMDITCHYVLATTNEGLILQQELIDKLVFQRFFNITYLGQIIQCSIEFPPDTRIEFSKIDLTSKEPNIKHLEIPLKIKTNYPIINERTEMSNDKIISTSKADLYTVKHDPNTNESIVMDKIEYGSYITNKNSTI